MNIGGQFDLTYCSNIHAGETWGELFRALSRSLPSIRESLQVAGPFGIGLRLSAAAARTLESAPAFDEFRSFLRDGDYYVPTINGFPKNAFIYRTGEVTSVSSTRIASRGCWPR
jgi:hypothetical protein